MKINITAALLLLTISLSYAQIVTISPSDADGDAEVTLTFDATQGDGGLVGNDNVYIHAGVVLSPTDQPGGGDWSNVVGNWGQDDGIGQMTAVPGQTDKWEITFSPSIRDYFSVDEGTTIFWISMVFRSADGNTKGAGTPGNFDGGYVADNGDIFVRLDVGEFVTFSDLEDEYFIVDGSSIDITAEGSNQATSMELQVDEGSGFVSLGTEADVTEITKSYTPSGEGTVSVRVLATINGEEVDNTSSVTISFRPEVVVEAIPSGISDGINYDDSDDTKVTLSLLAPGIDFVYVVGDFNNWELNDSYVMKQDSNDPDRFWLEVTGLTAGEPYVFQYWVEGTVKIGDPYADQVADPWNDDFIPAEVFPNIPEYDFQDYAIATVIETAQEEFVWADSEDTWERPDQQELIVYELLMRDFIGTHYYQDLIDTLDYLEDLGVNAIEFMPIMEFEGNESWGYNPMYFFAVDKYYGTKDDLKEFIQAAHERGIAVILDMVLNHAFGLNAMVRMHWDSQLNTVSAESPWFNQYATHPFNVGFDFNHESEYTKKFVDDVNRYWIEEFHFDGYRFDLSKGFTQTNNPDNVGAWGQYDQSRIDLLTRMADEIWAVDPEAYVILEHFADGSEETVLKDYGMMVWGNNNHDFRNLLKGSSTSNSYGGASDFSRVSYMESHDEERVAFEMKEFGSSRGSYDIKEEENYFQRTKLGAAFFFTLSGPKMLWQFQELGYDIELNDDRLANKPLPWGDGNLGYYEDERRQAIYDAYAEIINLRADNQDLFNEGTYDNTLNASSKRIKVSHDDKNLIIIGNFNLDFASIAPQFTQAGDWYDFATGERISVSSLSQTFSLAPGEYMIFSDWPIKDVPEVTSASSGNLVDSRIYPTFSADYTVFEAGSSVNQLNVIATSLDGRRIELNHNQTTDNKYRIDLNVLNEGLYIIEVRSDQGFFSTKLIKN